MVILTKDIIAFQMFDHNAVDVAQRVHEGILKRAKCFKAGCRLIYGTLALDSAVLEGAYIDDHLVLGIVRRDVATKVVELDVDDAERSREAYTAAELPGPESKRFDL